jgi:hypothetical protein
VKKQSDSGSALSTLHRIRRPVTLVFPEEWKRSKAEVQQAIGEGLARLIAGRIAATILKQEQADYSCRQEGTVRWTI